jgi:DNA polymerase-1
MTTLLIDGDVEAFKAASVSQEKIDWGDDNVTIDTDEKGAEDYLVSALDHYRDILKADRLVVCLTAPDNWRKKLWPEYKANRREKERPALLGHCRGFLSTHYETECWPRLEADDVMGILSSTIRDSVIVSVDKDMKTIPCRLYNPNKPDEGVVIVDDVMGHEWHMIQTLTGDSTDGYPGCPGIGPKKAGKIITEVFGRVDPIRNYSAWRRELWDAIVDAYKTKGLDAEDALLNARLAYILRRPEEYNRETAKLRLWQPPT